MNKSTENNPHYSNSKARGNFFMDVGKIKKIDTKRIIFMVVFMLSFIFTEIGREIYRPFIYSNNLMDYGLADSIGNLGGIVVQIFFVLTIINPPRKKAYRLIVFMIFGYILYEILQPYLPKGTFDYLDIYATLIGGLLAYLIYGAVNLSIKQNKIYYQFN